MSPVSRGSTAIISSVVFTSLAACLILARLIARLTILKVAGRDELAITISLLSSIAFTILVCEQVKYGLGKHTSAVSLYDLERVRRYLWWSILCYNSSLTLTKISIVLQYLRVFVGPRIRYACWSTIGLIMIYGIWTIASAIFTCVPIAAFWDVNIHGRCIPHKFLWFFNAAVNIATDLTILILPMPVLSTLRLPLKQKVGLMFIFALGGFVCLVSILRLRSLYIVSTSEDVTWANTEAAIWSSIEINTGIVCASLPTIKPVISWIFPRLLSSNRADQPTFITNGSHSQNRLGRTPVELVDFGTTPQTISKVEVSDNPVSVTRDGTLQGGRLADDGSKVILIVTSVAQDVESRSEMGSEKDLVY
ncbi:hypothetical protein BKA64DRAFT_680100 [Cadophora sp. MPI-SDFR-AT-0126]|nr:hypothetical protein BKA64DRAFT_680100 [Leotiomycetes sp. MPI-SDFR-AT-0126]